MDFDQLKKAISRSTRSGGSTGSANKSNQVIQNWTNNQSSNIAEQQQTQQRQQGDTVTSIDAALKRLDVQNERQNQDLKNRTEANDFQKFMKTTKDVGDQIADITGFNEAYAKAKKDTNVGNVLDAAGKFVTGLPGQMVGGLVGAPSKFYEAATGDNIQEMQHDAHTGKDYISTQKLDAEQRVAAGGDALIDVVGIPLGGSGKLVGSVGRVVADAAGKDITKGVGKLAVDVAKGAAEEAGEEFTQAWLENVRGTEQEHGVSNAIKNSDKIMGEALENAALGAAGGGIMGAGGHALDALRTNRDSNSSYSKSQSSASIGNSAPVTPRHDYHEQGTTDSTGHLTQTAQQAVKEQAERGGTTDHIPGVQSATNLTIVEDNTKGQNDFGMGFDDLVAAMHNEIEHEYWQGNPQQTSAEVYTEALGGRDEVEAAIKQWDAKQTSNATKIGSFDNLFAKYSASANRDVPHQGSTNLESHQIAKRQYDKHRIDFLNAYINGDANMGISAHDSQFAMGKNPANEHQMRTMWLTGIHDGTGYHMNSANHKAFNSDTDGDRLFATTRKAFYGDKGGAYSWQRYADETETPVKVLDGSGNEHTINAHLKDRLGMTDRANSIKSETNKDGSLPEWGKEGEATNKLVSDIKKFCAKYNITNKKSIKRLKNAARTFARFNAFDSDNYGTTEQNSMFKHDFDKHGELCTTAAQLQAIMLEEVKKANPGLFKDDVATRQDANVANEAAAILDRGDDAAYIKQMLAENDTAINSSLNAIRSYIDEVAPVSVDGVMDEESFSEHKGEISSALEATFGKIAKLFSLHISYANSHSPQLFRDSQNLLYEVKGALSNCGISDGQFSNVMEIYLSRLMHINQLTESNTDLVKTIISDLVWADMNTKYPEGIPTSKKDLDQFLLDFARNYDEGVGIIDKAYKKANATPRNWGTEQEGKSKDYSKIVPKRIFKDGKPGEEVTSYEFHGSEKEALLSAITRTYGQNALNKIFQYEGAYEDITISSLVSARMSNPAFMDGNITGNPVIDGLINDLLKNEIEARKREARTVTSDIESVLAVQKKIVGRIDDSKGRIHAEDVPAYTNLLDFISQLLGARNAVNMGIVDVYTVLSEKNKDAHKYVQALLRSKTKEEFLSRLMGAKLFADFDKIQYLHSLLGDDQYADSRDNIIRSIIVEADKVGNYSPLHRAVVNYMFQYSEDSTLPDINLTVLDKLCDPDVIWDEKIAILTTLNSDPARRAWNQRFTENNAEDLILSWLLDDETSNSALSKKSTRLADASKFGEQAKQLDNAQLKREWTEVKKEFEEGRADLHKTVEHLVDKMRYRVPYETLSGLVMENTKPSNQPAEKGTDAPYSASAADAMNLETNGAVTNNISMLINGVLGNVTEDQFNDNGYFLLSLLTDDDMHIDIDMRDGSLVEDVSKKSLFRECGLEYTKGQPLTASQLDAIIEKYPQVLTAFCEQVPQVSPVGDARTKWARRRNLKDTITQAIKEQVDGAKAAEAALKDEWMFSWLSDSEGRRFVLSLLDLSNAANLTQADVLHQLYRIRDGLYSMLLDLQDAYEKSVAFTDSGSAFTNKVNEILHHFGVKSVEALQLSRSIKEVFDQANSQYETQGSLSALIQARQEELLALDLFDVKSRLNNLISEVRENLNAQQKKDLDKALDLTDIKGASKISEERMKEFGEKVAKATLAHQNNTLANGQYIALLALKEAAKRSKRIDVPGSSISRDFEKALELQRDEFESAIDQLLEDAKLTDPDGLAPMLEQLKNEALAGFDSVLFGRDETIPVYETIDKDGLSHLELSQKFVDSLIQNGMRPDNLMDMLPHILQQQWIGELAANPSGIRDSFVANVVEHCEWIHDTWNTDEKPPTVEYLEGLIDAIENKTDEADAAFDALEELFRNWNLLNGRNGLAYASVPNHFDPTLNPDAGNTVSNVIDNLSAIGKLLTDAVDGENGLSEHLRKRIGQSRTNDSGKRSEWKKLKISLDADSVWTASRASFQAGTGSIPSGVAADNMLNRFMLPVYLLDGDTVCATPGSEKALSDIDYDQMLNGRLWYSTTNDPKSARLLNDTRHKELSKKGVAKIYVWDVDEHSRSCTCPGCKLQAPAPTGSKAPNYGPLKDLFRRFINACEPNWLKLKKSMDKAKALDYSVSARPELIEVQKWRLQASANYKGSINGDLHTFIQQETDPSSTAGYRFKYREILTDMFLNDENYSGIEFGETEANLLTNFLTNYVNIEINDKIVATVTLDQLKAWDAEIQASKGQRTLVDILAEKIKADPNNIKNKSINLSFKPVSVHSMMQIAAQHSLEQAAKHDFLGKDQPTQDQYAQWVQEAWALDNGAEFKSASFDDLMAGYGTRTKYLGAQRKFGWSVSPTQAVREILSDGLDYRRTPYNTDFDKVKPYNERNDKNKNWPRARSAARRLFGLMPFKDSYKQSSDVSLGHVFKQSNGKQVDTLRPAPDEVPNVLDFNEGNAVRPSSNVWPEVFGDDMVLNVCADKSLTEDSIKWLVDMQNRMGYDKRFLVMPKAWYDEYQEGKGQNEEDLVQETDTMTWNGYTMVVLAPRNSYVEFVRNYNGYTPVVQADQANIGRVLVVDNDDVPDGGMMLFDNPSIGELVLADSGTRKIPVDEWNNGPNGQTSAQLLSRSEVYKLLKKLSSGDIASLQKMGFDFGIAEKQFGISKKDQAASIATFVQNLTGKGYQKNSDHLEGVMSKGDCVGILVTKDINGRKRYQPVFVDGSLPEMTNVTDVKLSNDGKSVEIAWNYRRSFKDAIESGYSQKVYFHPAFKAEVTLAPSYIQDRYRIAGSDWLDGVISHEAFDSRAKEKEQELFARNMYYNWLKEDHGSVFLSFDENGGYSWNSDLSIDLIDADGRPTELLRQLLAGNDKAWEEVANGDIKLLDENAGEWVKNANWAIRGLVNDCLYNATRVNPMMVLSDTAITLEHGSPIRGMQWNADFGTRTTDLFYFNGSVKLQLAFFHALNPKMCAATLNEEAAAIAATTGNNPATPKFKYTHDNKMLVRDPSKSKTHKTLYWCTYVTDHIRTGQENTEALGTGTEGNIGSQQQLKYAADGFYLTDDLVQYNMLFANAMGQGNPEYVLTHQKKHARTNMIAKAVKGPKNRRDVEIVSNKFKTMDEQMPSWAYAKGKHAEALNEIGRSFAQSPVKIVDGDGNAIDYVEDKDIQIAVRNFSKELTGSETGINAFEAINWFYKFYIGYTSSGYADISFYKSDLLDGLKTMTSNLDDGMFLPIKGGISKTFMNEKLGDRVAMPILPQFLTERIFKMNPAIAKKGKYKTARAWQKAQLEEYMASRDEILAITDTAKRTNLSKFAEWIGLTTHLDTQMHAFGDVYVAQEYNELHQQLLEALNYISPVSMEINKSLVEATQKRIEDSRAVRRSGHTSQHLDADGNPTVAVEEGVTKEAAYKFVRYASAANKFMRLLNPLITAGALAERGTYTTMTRFALFASNKLGVGPYRTTADFDFDGRFTLAKEVSKDKNSLALFAAIRENEVNGDFSWNYEEFSNIEQFMGALKKIEKNKSKIERWQRKLTDIMAGKGVFAKGQIENFWNFFCSYGMEHAARGEEQWVNLFAKTEAGGKSIFQSELENGGAARLMARVLSPQSPYRGVAIVALNHSKRCDMAQRSAIGMIYSELVKDKPLAEAAITTGFCPFVNYTINTTERVLNFIAPMSTLRYIFINLISKYNGKIPGRDITWDQLHLEDAQLTNSLREALALDAAKMGSAALAALLISLSGAVEPPEDDDKWQNTEEWTIFGLRIQENWWLSDLLGPAMAMVCFARSWELGQPRFDILTSKLGDCLYSNPALKAGGLIGDMLDPWSAVADAAETDNDIYGKTKQGDVTFAEMVGSDAAVYAMNYLCQFFTPSVLKEIYRDSQTYAVSYKKVYKTDEYGQIVYNDDGTAAVEYTNYLDAKFRKLARQNPVWALLCDLATGNGASTTGTGYLASEMPEIVIYDPEQIASYKTFSLYNEDGTEKDDNEKEAVALAVISLLQGNDLDELKSEGFAVPYDTLKYTGDVVKSIINKNSDVYKQFVDEGGMDYYKQGNGDYNLGKEQVEKIKAAYDNDTRYWKDFYYNVLWSDQMKQSITKYKQYNTLYDTDANGNYYATGYARGIAPVLIAQGTTTNPGETTGWSGDWGTASAVTGKTMYDTNGNALRALEPYTEIVETPSLETNGYSSGWQNYNYSGYGRYYSRGRSGWRSYGGGSSRSYARSGGSVYSNAKSAYPNNLSYRSYNAGDLTNLVASRANIYGSNLDYLRPGFTIKGSRQGYKRNDY